MTLHISATTGCNLGCTYCYENPDRERKQEWVDRQYDMDEIMEQLDKWMQKYPNEAPGMHGGEPLLVRKDDLETIFSHINENYDGASHIQTNGTLMDEDHVEMFEKYNVVVGISCDGPPELNKERKAAGERNSSQEDVTNNMTEATNNAIEMCMNADVDMGIITVLHETNAGTEERFEKLLDWLDWLTKNGVSGHFNPAIPYDDIPDSEDLALDRDTLKERYLRAWEWHKEEPYHEWGPMRSYLDNLLGLKLHDCTNAKCDVSGAGAAKIITGDGETTGCGKTWGQYGDGGVFLQGESTDSEFGDGDERYGVLKNTPGWVTEGEPDMGGCKGCKYWNVCQGGCPGAGQNDDYRNRTHFCKAKYALYEAIEDDVRAIMPNIRMITDVPWDEPIADEAARWNLDIKPFAAMDPSEGGRTSTAMNFEHGYGTPTEEARRNSQDQGCNGDCNCGSGGQCSSNNPKELIEKYSQEVGEENVTYDPRSGEVHADGSMAEVDEVAEGRRVDE